MAEPASLLVWLLLGAKAGDNAQVRRLAALLPGQKLEHQLEFSSLHALPNLLLGASLASLKPAARARLAPPWPALVIAAGKRSVPVARWIRRQSAAKSRLVHIGRPRAPLADFDLVITTPQYGLPPGENVLELPLPLAGRPQADMAGFAQWQAAWRDLPRPLVGVAVGSSKYPLRFEANEQEELARLLNLELAPGGSVLLIASPRTSPEAVPRMAAMLKVPHLAYSPFERGSNPYAAALMLCDRLVVTGDSASMIADALRASKPVDVFRLPVSQGRMAWSARRGLGRLLSRHGMLQPPRAMDHLIAKLLADGVVGELGRSAGRGLDSDYEAVAVERVMRLVTAR